jgi:hypothetical protein
LSEARDIVCWLHDGMGYRDHEIARYLGIDRTAVCRIRNGEPGYSGHTVRQLLRDIRPFERNGVKYAYPYYPLPKRRNTLSSSYRRCTICRAMKGRVLQMGNHRTKGVEYFCDDCYDRYERQISNW